MAWVPVSSGRSKPAAAAASQPAVASAAGTKPQTQVATEALRLSQERAQKLGIDLDLPPASQAEVTKAAMAILKPIAGQWILSLDFDADLHKELAKMGKSLPKGMKHVQCFGRNASIDFGQHQGYWKLAYRLRKAGDYAADDLSSLPRSQGGVALLPASTPIVKRPESIARPVPPATQKQQLATSTPAPGAAAAQSVAAAAAAGVSTPIAAPSSPAAAVSAVVASAAAPKPAPPVSSADAWPSLGGKFAAAVAGSAAKLAAGSLASQSVPSASSVGSGKASASSASAAAAAGAKPPAAAAPSLTSPASSSNAASATATAAAPTAQLRDASITLMTSLGIGIGPTFNTEAPPPTQAGEQGQGQVLNVSSVEEAETAGHQSGRSGNNGSGDSDSGPMDTSRTGVSSYGDGNDNDEAYREGEEGEDEAYLTGISLDRAPSRPTSIRGGVTSSSAPAIGGSDGERILGFSEWKWPSGDGADPLRAAAAAASAPSAAGGRLGGGVGGLDFLAGAMGSLDTSLGALRLISEAQQHPPGLQPTSSSASIALGIPPPAALPPGIGLGGAPVAAAANPFASVRDEDADVANPAVVAAEADVSEMVAILRLTTGLEMQSIPPLRLGLASNVTEAVSAIVNHRSLGSMWTPLSLLSDALAVQAPSCPAAAALAANPIVLLTVISSVQGLAVKRLSCAAIDEFAVRFVHVGNEPPLMPQAPPDMRTLQVAIVANEAMWRSVHQQPLSLRRLRQLCACWGVVPSLQQLREALNMRVR